ncbi:Very-long-chain 3-oxoacyl-CoA reductase [Lachnellula willkommii]|uniref:Very-long-chain 3-oxoacyl-CoA reductase n=1 Tax=Lachnellula willkommii TaxID=215461 RepID=A0A559MA84_9HELO|nr:Very-long-chain 3-oxoacyl-CoA reductase [Lachnellula willkommii]
MLPSHIMGSLSSLSLSWIRAIGVFYLIRKAGDIYLLLVELFVLSGLRKYGEKGSWAVINGVEDVLGTEYALALASHGSNPLFLSRTQSKLETLTQDFNSRFNNNSPLHTIPVLFVLTDKEEIRDIISVNCTATLMVTRLIAHGMVQRHRGLILTMGSFNGLFATPLLAT